MRGSSDGAKTEYDADHIYRAQADDYGGMNFKYRAKIKDSGKKEK